MRILFLSRWFPYPPENGSQLRILNLIKHLAARHELALISFAEQPATHEHLDALRAYCRQVHVVPYRSFRPRRLKSLLGFFSPQPRSFVATYSPELSQVIARTAHITPFDVVIASQIDMAPYALGVPGARRILEEVELTGLREQVTKQRYILGRARGELTWWKAARYLAYLLRSYDGCTVVSEQERQLVAAIAPAGSAIAVTPNGVDFSSCNLVSVTPVDNSLIYAGALTYGANFDAVAYFLREIFSHIRAARPTVHLTVTGRLDGVPLDRLPTSAGVAFTGRLDDIRSTVASSWISIVPVRQGGGTRLKILESLALGTPVVSTSKGAEGLALVPDRDLLIADTPADFAAAVIRLLSDPALRARLSQNGRRAAAQYDWMLIGPQFTAFVERVAAQTDAPHPMKA